ncbi:MAG: protein kinase [Saprospiraceae bacterium]|nr:protein kinase [Saprospiraceae bacterium]
MHEYGECEIFNRNKDYYEKHRFYTMEYAPFDLKTFIEINHMTVDYDFKLNLCLSLAKGLEELRRLDYYHRDIKPDNIFFIDGDWKIGDLGLIAERNKQFEIDKVAETIGPRGWMSPESMNKYLTEGKGFPNLYDCIIDHRSDIFQLGKVFWYIFNFNAPIGCIKPVDMHFKDNDIYPIMRRMLNHNKKKRFSTIEDVITELKRISLKSLKTLTY